MGEADLDLDVLRGEGDQAFDLALEDPGHLVVGLDVPVVAAAGPGHRLQQVLVEVRPKPMQVVLTRLAAPARRGPSSLVGSTMPTFACPSVSSTTRLVPSTMPFSTSFRPLSQPPERLVEPPACTRAMASSAAAVAAGRRAEDRLDARRRR